MVSARAIRSKSRTPFELENVGGLKEVWAELVKVEQRTRIELANASLSRFFLFIGPSAAATKHTMLFLNGLVCRSCKLTTNNLFTNGI
jgi:hypothetical protein